MLRLTKLLFSLSNNDGIIKGHCMKIPDIIKLEKQDLNFLKKKIFFNHLLLREI
ncbi:hypothetical protein, partial [Plasmodium yoelii yoelii]